MRFRSILVLLSLFVLCQCGQVKPPQATAIPPTQAAVKAATATPVPTSAPGATATPVATFVAIMVNIDSPSATQSPDATPAPSRTIEIDVAGQKVIVELASNNAERERGLMFRKTLDENAGMLFIFPSDQKVSFWMRDTPLPLSVAFIEANGTIAGLDEMQPFDDQNIHYAPKPVRYVLEMNTGWFSKRGIKAGDKVSITLPSDLVIQ